MISEHISLSEGVRSITAKRLGLDNTPNEEHLNNMKLLAVNVFDPLRIFDPLIRNYQIYELMYHF